MLVQSIQEKNMCSDSNKSQLLFHLTIDPDGYTAEELGPVPQNVPTVEQR